MAVYKLRALGTGGTEDSAASLDIQFEGFITAIWGAMDADLDTADDTARFEVSFLSSNTHAVNDARGSLFQMRLREAQTAAGANMAAVNGGIGGIRVPVLQGERIHMHVEATAGVSSTCQCYLYVEDQSVPAILRRR